jgi:hypothetical protein
VVTRPVTTVAPSTTTSTTLAGLSGGPTAPATVPLVTKASNGHVNSLFAWLSVAGFGLSALIVAFRLFVTRPGGLDRKPLSVSRTGEHR